ncbi:hypothetical protein IMG5_151400 [Ichthyophthirius multifiliis]|uniref:Uncharacterized protein n=1 Tax=Ichthyophthirius multifiliis TaxID=5932 RepID=G0QYP3_ICHMU|nr:hypothetical protein IMG5_151400 [Ichthyophthirius multifiliis]EGR29670.1 hypothetical protein IMG5_151400 [Ichthyophthirius multifiliis]|eukprot:XP_004030906.1 hypothetical protein IMG5_151400 [Ichthyophthirius multifiliis]
MDLIKTSGFEQSQDQIEDLPENLWSYINFNSIYRQHDYYEAQFCKYTNRNNSWKSALFLEQNILLDLNQLTNVKQIEIEDFKYGCEMSISISQDQTGPYIDIYTKKYFCRATNKNISISNLPFGIISEEIIKLLGVDYFKLMVTGPQRLFYI